MHWSRRIFWVGAVVITFVAVHPGRAAENLKVTPKSGTIDFVGSKDDGSHKGGFKEFSGTVALDERNPGASKVVLEIATGSIWSDNPKLTAHLRNADFFHVDKFPKAVFRSTAVRDAKPEEREAAGGKITHVLSGELTLLGVARKLDLPVKIQLAADALSVEGAYPLDRTRFEMNYGAGKIHETVMVSFSLKMPRGAAMDDQVPDESAPQARD